MSSAGGLLLVDAVRAAGLDRTLSQVLAPWRKPLAIHDPAKIVCDLAISLALGGDCLADIAKVRGEPGVYGPVASDPTVSRLIDALAADASQALAAIDTARAGARARVWALAGEDAPDDATSGNDPLVVDLDATLVTAHSEKDQAAATFKRSFGFQCAMRRSVISPTQSGSTWREVLESNGLPKTERLMGPEHARKSAVVSRRMERGTEGLA